MHLRFPINFRDETVEVLQHFRTFVEKNDSIHPFQLCRDVSDGAYRLIDITANNTNLNSRPLAKMIMC